MIVDSRTKAFPGSVFVFFIFRFYMRLRRLFVLEFSLIDTLWVFLAAILVFFMNLGFANVEAGFARSKKHRQHPVKKLHCFCRFLSGIFVARLGIDVRW